MLKDRNDRGPRSTSSEIWRKTYSPYVLECLKNDVPLDKIIVIYSLRIFLYSESNTEKIMQCFKVGKIQKAFSIGRLPIGFENDESIAIGELVFIKTQEKDLISILCDNQKGRHHAVSLKRLELISFPFSPEEIVSRMLIYPV